LPWIVTVPPGEVEVAHLQEPELVSPERQPAEELDRDLVAEVGLGSS
jgi:hypothetical protein